MTYETHRSIWVVRKMCSMHTNPVLRWFSNSERLNWSSAESGYMWSLGRHSQVRPGMGKYLSIGPDRVDGPPTSPRCKSRPGGFMQHSLVIPIGRSWMARYQHTQRGVMETSRPRHWVPSMGPRIVPATSQPLCHFVPRSICFGWRWPDWWVLPWNPEVWQTHNNHGAHFGYGCCMSCCRSWRNVRGVRVACKHGFTMPCKGLLLYVLGCDTMGL
jgi:hypothetical protein